MKPDLPGALRVSSVILCGLALPQTRSMIIAMPWPTPMHIVHSA